VQPRSIVGVIPEVIDPDYTYIVVNTSVKYDPKGTTRTPLQLQDAIKSNVLTFARTERREVRHVVPLLQVRPGD
jgi:hypothetical protein